MEIELLYQKFLQSGKVSTDTRKITPGSVFFALSGEKFDGNRFAGEALEKGASVAVVSDSSVVKDERYVLVEDTLNTLQELARFHRKQFSIPFIGLTGSNGKTTSKELTGAVLRKKYNVLATQGNLNNHIGVPLTVLSVTPETEIAIIEMGANHVGEIALLCSIANPTHGFITNIGKAHIGTFGGFDNIVRGKSELYQHLIAHEGVVWINSQNHILSNMAKRFKSPLFYPAKGDYYSCTLLGADPYLKIKAENGEEITTQLIGDYNFENVAAALCIGRYFNVDSHQANEAIAEYVPGNMRSQVIRKGSNTIILDAYNANPSSMKAALENLAAMKADKKIVVVGDMFELEEESEAEHKALGALILEKGFTDVYLCGKLIRAALTVIPFAKYFEEKSALTNHLEQNPVSDATILIKASRGIGLETIVDSL